MCGLKGIASKTQENQLLVVGLTVWSDRESFLISPLWDHRTCFIHDSESILVSPPIYYLRSLHERLPFIVFFSLNNRGLILRCLFGKLMTIFKTEIFPNKKSCREERNIKSKAYTIEPLQHMNLNRGDNNNCVETIDEVGFYVRLSSSILLHLST